MITQLTYFINPRIAIKIAETDWVFLGTKFLPKRTVKIVLAMEPSNV